MFGKRTRSKSNLNASQESLGPSNSSGDSHSTAVNIGDHNDQIDNSLGIDNINLKFNSSLHTRQFEFSAYYLGTVSKLMMVAGNRKSLETQFISKIEEEQLDGKVKLKPLPIDEVLIKLDHHGFQISRNNGDDVVLRVPLHTLAKLVMYYDGFNKSNLAMKVIVGKDMFSCHVFQCPI